MYFNDQNTQFPLLQTEPRKLCIYEVFLNQIMKDINEQIIPADINISTALLTVIEISERSHIIELKFKIDITWYEHRARYYNIKQNSALNVLSADEIKLMWLPYIIFQVIFIYKQNVTNILTPISNVLYIYHEISFLKLEFGI